MIRDERAGTCAPAPWSSPLIPSFAATLRSERRHQEQLRLLQVIVFAVLFVVPALFVTVSVTV